MNNKYDREPTYDEMIAAGYTMSGEGFWIPPEGEERPHPKLLLLESGEQVITVLIEKFDEYILDDPREVRIESTFTEEGSVTNSVAYSNWMPLSKSRRIRIKKDYVVSICDPMDSLSESYLGDLQNG